MASMEFNEEEEEEEEEEEGEEEGDGAGDGARRPPPNPKRGGALGPPSSP